MRILLHHPFLVEYVGRVESIIMNAITCVNAKTFCAHRNVEKIRRDTKSVIVSEVFCVSERWI